MDVSQSDEIGDYKTHVYGTLVSITDIILLIPIHLIIIVELKQLIVLQSHGIWQKEFCRCSFSLIEYRIKQIYLWLKLCWCDHIHPQIISYKVTLIVLKLFGCQSEKTNIYKTSLTNLSTPQPSWLRLHNTHWFCVQYSNISSFPLLYCLQLFLSLTSSPCF